MAYRYLKVERQDRLAKLILNRPRAHNALSAPLLRELMDALKEIKLDEACGVVLITAVGEAFSVGIAKGDSRAAELIAEVVEAVEGLEKPVIALVQGAAAGAGLGLALACDFIIATPTAVFSEPSASLGMLPTAGNSQKLPRLLGSLRAKEMLLTCQPLSAVEAQRLGLVNRVVAEDELEATAWSLAQRILSLDPQSVGRLKLLINQGLKLELERALLLERIELLHSLHLLESPALHHHH